MGLQRRTPRLPHCTHPLDEPCDSATHAEANSIAFAARQGISTDNGLLIVSVSPCVDCSRLLIAAGIREIYYRERYRDPAGIELLEDAGVEVHHVRL